MTIDRVSTNLQAQYLLSQVMQASDALDKSQAQVSSGKQSQDYAGLGDKTAALESARAAKARADSYQSNTQLAVTQTNMQDTQLTSLSGLANELQQAITTASGNGDGSSLMSTASDIFDQAAQILNSTNSSGNYIYAGQTADRKPFTGTSLASLGGTPPPAVSSFFQNGTQKKSVVTGDGQTVQIGVLASDVGTQLMTALQDLVQADTPPGSLGGQLTSAQSTMLTTNVLPDARAAATGLNDATAQNGEVYQRLQETVTTQQSLSTMYAGFVSNIEDADMGKAVINLNQDQVALQAALQVTAKLGQISLLNYLPAASATG